MAEPEIQEKQRVLPERRLPFDQISLEKQIDMLKCYVAYYSKEGKAAGYKEIAPLAKITPQMVSGSLKFWVSVGVLVKNDGKYVPSKELIDFCNKLSWGAELEAWSELRDALVNAWFVKHVEMSFSVHAKASEEELLNSLGSAIGAPKTKSIEISLKRLIELLEKAQFIKKENGLYSWAPPPKPVRRIVEIPEDKELITFIIGGDKFAVSLEELKKFVLDKGRKLPTKEHNLG